MRAHFPAGRYNVGYIVTSGGSLYIESVYYAPDSTPEQTLVVQEDMVFSWPEAPLPTDYWTRPIAHENREGWPILGNYPWVGPATDPFFKVLYPDTNLYGARARILYPNSLFTDEVAVDPKYLIV